MTGRTALLAITALGIASPLGAGDPTTGTLPDARIIEVHMKDIGGGQWRFDPSEVRARQGDTVRFVQDDIVPHNVQFKDEPDGAELGAAQMGPFLLTKGQAYDLVLDGRFAPGTYRFVCTPHEMLGMKGTLEVTPRSTSERSVLRPVPQGGTP